MINWFYYLEYVFLSSWHQNQFIDFMILSKKCSTIRILFNSPLMNLKSKPLKNWFIKNFSSYLLFLGWKEAEYRMVHQRERMVWRGIAADALQPEWCHQNEGLCYLRKQSHNWYSTYHFEKVNKQKNGNHRDKIVRKKCNIFREVLKYYRFLFFFVIVNYYL